MVHTRTFEVEAVALCVEGKLASGSNTIPQLRILVEANNAMPKLGEGAEPFAPDAAIPIENEALWRGPPGDMPSLLEGQTGMLSLFVGAALGAGVCAGRAIREASTVDPSGCGLFALPAAGAGV